MKNLKEILDEQLLLEFPWYMTKRGRFIDLGLEKVGKNNWKKLFEILYKFIYLDYTLVSKPWEEIYEVKFSELDGWSQRDLKHFLKDIIKKHLKNGEDKEIIRKIKYGKEEKKVVRLI